MIKVFIWRYYIENYIRNVVLNVYMIFKKIWIWIKGIFVWFCSIIGLRFKVWIEREMIEEVVYEFLEVKK